MNDNAKEKLQQISATIQGAQKNVDGMLENGEVVPGSVAGAILCLHLAAEALAGLKQ